MTEENLMWWGYRHQNGTIQVKRWFGDHKDYTTDCEGNEFVEKVVKPFAAPDHERALLHILHAVRMPITDADAIKIYNLGPTWAAGQAQTADLGAQACFMQLMFQKDYLLILIRKTKMLESELNRLKSQQ